MKVQFIGSGGHSGVLRDICEMYGIEIVQESDHKVVAFGGIDCMMLEKRFDQFNALQDIFPCMIHDSAYISNATAIGRGTHVFPNAVVNRDARIGDFCIINTSAVIEHGAEIGNGCHIAPGAVVLGNAKIGDFCFIGANAVVVQGSVVPCNSFVKAAGVWKNK